MTWAHHKNTFAECSRTDAQENTRTKRDGHHKRDRLAIFYKDNLDIQTDIKIIETTDIEHLTIRLIYNRDNFLNEDELLALADFSRMSLVLGDYNTWGNKYNNIADNTLYRIVENTEFILYTPETPTRYSADEKSSSTIDLIL